MNGVLFEIAHPKHYLQFKYAIKRLSSLMHVHVVARDKDVVLRLLEADNVAFERYGVKRRGFTGKLLAAPRVLAEYRDILVRERPSLIVSKSSPYATLLGHHHGATTVVMPDSEGVWLNERFVIPRADYVVTPETYRRDYGAKHLRVSGVFEAGYLHPRHFAPDASVPSALGLSEGEPYCILRFVSWEANHDIGRTGISNHQKAVLATALMEHMPVFISSEGQLPEALRGYRLPLPAHKLHDALYYAALYVGDSQTMATEAALLGTPSVRCNSFVGAHDFSNFVLLERDFRLLYNYMRFDDALQRSLELASTPGTKEIWAARRNQYFASVGDINEEITDILMRLVGTHGQRGTQVATASNPAFAQ